MTGDVFNFHVLAYRKAKPEETKQHDLEQLRPITFEFELQNGMWTWARVTSPADPKPEEVAKELYGFPGLAVHLLGAAPLFGFKPSRLTAAHQQRWKEKAGEAATPGSPGRASADSDKAGLKDGAMPVIDPATEILAGPKAEEAALNQARAGKPTGADRTAIVQRLRLMLPVLDTAVADATVFGLAGRVEPIKAKVDARSKKLSDAEDPAEGAVWDAHSAQLAQLVSDASGGLARAADRYRKMGVPADDPGGQRSVAPHVRKVLLGVVSGYVDAIALSDLVTTGRAKLAEADERAKTYPIDVAEAMFAAIRPMLENAKKDKRGGHGRRSPRRRGRTQARGGPPPAARRDPPVAAVRPGGRPAPARPAPDRARRASDRDHPDREPRRRRRGVGPARQAPPQPGAAGDR